MADHGDGDGSEDVADFLERIRELGDQRKREDEERARKLEEEILQGRKERQARRAERARSISPTKDSPLNSSFSSTQYHAESPTSRTKREEKMESDKVVSAPMRGGRSEESTPLEPTKPNPPESAGISRSGTLSWQQRPSSRGSPAVRSRPLPPPVSEKAGPSPVETSRDASPEATAVKRDQALSMLEGKDPSWFRQTADRGKSSAANRKPEGNSNDITENVRLPGLGRNSSDLGNPLALATGSMRTPSPSYEGNVIDGSSGQATMKTTAQTSVSASPMPTMSSQRFHPPSGSATSPPPDTNPRSKSPIMSPAQGRISPERLERPSSPTKGLGGFVQSAMMKRSDSVSKRWSAQAAAGLTRGDSVSKHRGGATSPTRGGPAQRISVDLAAGPRQAFSPSDRPPLNMVKDQPGDPGNEEQKPTELDQELSANRVVESKRWSPTKASWLEAAINKSEPPKPRPVAPAQPSWMVEINKAKKARNEAESGNDSSDKPSNPEGSQSPSVTTRMSTSEEPKSVKPVSRPASSSTFVGTISASPDPEGKVKPEAPAKVDFRSSLKNRPQPSQGAQGNEPEFKNVFGKLRKTETKNYVAPDELKNNITRGKAGLNLTGGPRPYQKKDEFKDSILKKKQEMKEGASVVNTGKVATTAAAEVPEAIAKRGSMSTRPASGEQARTTMIKSKDAGNSPTPRAAKPEWTKSTSASGFSAGPAQPRVSSETPGSKLADRFNPALAGILAKGPPSSKSTSSTATPESSFDNSKPRSIGGSSLNELTHTTKSRARGPKRKLPSKVVNASGSKDTPAENLENRADSFSGATLVKTRSEPVTEQSSDEQRAPDGFNLLKTHSQPTESPQTQRRDVTQRSTPGKSSSPKLNRSPPALKPKPTVPESKGSSVGSIPVGALPTSPPLTKGVISATDEGPAATPKKAAFELASKESTSGSRSPVSGPRDELRKEMMINANETIVNRKPQSQPKSPPLPSKKPISFSKIESGGSSAALATEDGKPETKEVMPQSEAAKLLSRIFKKPLSDVANNPFDVDTQTILQKTPATEKIRTLRKEIWEVTGDGKKISVPAQQEHILFDNSMFLCNHVFGAENGKRTTEVYLWCGKEVSPSAIEDAQLFCRNAAKDAGGKLIILEQGKEPSKFFEALGGIVITRQGTTSSVANSRYILSGRRHLGHVAFDEVAFSPSSLCTGFPFIIASSDGSKLFLWKGKGSGTDVVGCARLIAMDLGTTGDVDEVEEGSETRAFWKEFGLSQQSNAPWDYPPKASWEKYATRLFAVDADARSKSIGSGLLQWARRASTPAPEDDNGLVREIAPFTQRDLSREGIYVLDAFFELFVIVGNNAFSKLSTFHYALVFAQEYSVLAASVEDRPFIPAGKVVLGGIPEGVKHAFRRWDSRDAPTAKNEMVMDVNKALRAFGEAK